MSGLSGSAYPRVLLISAGSIAAPNGTGITLTSLFKGWPSGRLAQLHTTSSPHRSDVCPNARLLPSSAAPLDHFARRFIQRASTGQETPTAIAAVGSTSDSGPFSVRIRRNARAIADLSPVRLPRDLTSWVQDFQPQVIYTLLGSIRIMRLARSVSKFCDVPIVPHFMDDWPSTLYESGELLGYARRAVQRSLKGVVGRSSRGLGISATMVSEYRERYRIPFFECGNCINEEAFSAADSIGSSTPPRPLRVAYVGGLHLCRGDAIKEVGLAADEVGRQGRRVEVLVHAPDADLHRYRPLFSASPSIKVMHSLRAEEVNEALRAADVLLHVESFDPAITRYTRLSLSTKIPQYLAAGRPVLGYGPSSLASMSHLAGSAGGVVVSERRPAQLIRELSLLHDDGDLRASLGAAGRDFARAHHSSMAVTARMRDSLQAAAAEW